MKQKTFTKRAQIIIKPNPSTVLTIIPEKFIFVNEKTFKLIFVLKRGKNKIHTVFFKMHLVLILRKDFCNLGVNTKPQRLADYNYVFQSTVELTIITYIRI